MDLWIESWIFEIGNGLWKKNPTLDMVKGDISHFSRLMREEGDVYLYLVLTKQELY